MVAFQDFFISYNKADRAWAEWIAWQLENAGHTTIIQAWDFRPGTNFVSLMHHAATTATHTIAVLSPDYLDDAPYSEAEWIAAFAQDPTGKNAILIPVRVRACNPTGLLKTITYIDLVTLDEHEACTTLLQGINTKRAKPSTPSPFPVAPAKPTLPTPNFPGKWPLIENIPYSYNPYFTGREMLLQSLHNQLLKGNTTALTQAISGLGGIGKTQTAIEYAHRNRQQYRYILWIAAATLEGLLSDLSRLADLLEVPGRDPRNQQNTATSVKNFLAQQNDWLLIFDNADDIEMVRAYLPIGDKTNGHIILTTRAQAVGTVAHTVQVNEMDNEEGTQLLLKRGKLLKTGQLLDQVDASDRASAESIVEAVGGLPLALDQAAAYIEETGCSLSDYLKLYQTHHQNLLKRRGRLVVDHPETVATTWSLSFQKVESENKAAAELLRLCAFLAPDAIPEEIITEGASHLGKLLAPVAADHFLLNEALAVLRKYSLIKRNIKNKTLSMHRLVQQVLKDGMHKKVQSQWATRAIRAIDEVFPYGWDAENWPQCARLLAQAQICEELVEHYGLVFAEAARLFLYCGYYLYQQALYALVEPFFLNALSIAKQLDNSEYPRTFSVQHGLAMLYKEQGRYKESEELYKISLDKKQLVLGKGHIDTLETQHALAVLYASQDRYKEAEALYKEALEMKQRTHVVDHSSIASTQHALAALYIDQGSRYEEAMELYKEVLETRQRILGKEHPDTAMTQHNLAYIYNRQGKYEDAETLYKLALQTYEQKLGLEHPHTRIFLENYAYLLRAMNRTAEAEALEARIKPQEGHLE
jgi:tetratricopeptide (TPR) repeat protein